MTLVLWLYLTLLPEPWAAYLTCAGAHHGLFHPSEDLSEPPPLLETVAGRKYHDQLTGSWQRQTATACPADSWTRSPPSQAVIDGKSPTGGSSRNLRRRFYPFGAPSTNVIKSPDLHFSRFTGWLLKKASYIYKEFFGPTTTPSSKQYKTFYFSPDSGNFPVDVLLGNMMHFGVL